MACTLNQGRTSALVEWARSLRLELTDEFDFAQAVSKKLGVHLVDGVAEVGFWAPEVVEKGVNSNRIFLEVFEPLKDIHFEKEEQQVEFDRTLIPMAQEGDFLWLAAEGLVAGTRDQVGSFYWVKYEEKDGTWTHLCDPLPYSVPFGVFAPAEFYDIEAMQAQRKDKDYFQSLKGAGEKNSLTKVGPPTNILQMHVNTATPEGTLRGLTKVYQTISDKLAVGEALEPFEKNYIGYESIQLLPIEPTIEYEDGSGFWEFWNDDDPESDKVYVDLKKPDMTNWGYDIVIAGMSATNPCVLGSKRPDELLDFVAVLHNFSTGPIKLLLDVVYGHSDNQGIGILNHHFFAGANMYGQNMNFKHKQVRGIMLEMQRRKANVGIDAIRVDGAQDFKIYDPEANDMYHDDDYLQSMSDVVQEVAGTSYYPWFIFEDGRPWPRQDWELASSYRSVVANQPHIVQWWPLTFAHTTPLLYTFWITRWWRVKEIMEMGSHWVTGCANHDTVRRGTQVDTEEMINDKLGDTYPEILDKGYDNPAEKLLTYGMFPGQPMDFINASMRAPWSFMRNTDDKYGVKVVSEEKRFLDWQVTDENYDDDRNFRRLKKQGFTSRDGLYHFMHVLESVVALTDYNLDVMVSIMNATPDLAGPDLTVEVLKGIAKDWMDDLHDYANVRHVLDLQDDKRTQFNLEVRNFRLARSWLMDNLDLELGDYYNYKYPTEGSVLYYGLRNSNDRKEQVLFIANMEGIPVTVVPRDLPIPGLAKDGWKLAVASPDLEVAGPDKEVTFGNSEGLLFVRQCV